MRVLRKPTIKSEWSGLKGNKYRVWIVTNDNGTRYKVFHKDRAKSQFDASMRAYKKRLALRK